MTAEVEKQSKLVLACWRSEGIYIYAVVASWKSYEWVTELDLSAGPERLGGVCVQGEENEIQGVRW